MFWRDVEFLLHINADMSGRVMSLIESMVAVAEVYPNDEGFTDLTSVQGEPDPVWPGGARQGAALHRHPRRCRDRPNQDPDNACQPDGEALAGAYGVVVDITDDFNRDWVLRSTSLAAQWGINGASRALFCAPYGL